MALLSADEIAELHAAYNESLVDTCEIRRADVLIADEVPCAVVKGIRSTMPGAATQPFDRRVDFTLCLPLGTDILTADVVTIDVTGLRLRVGEVIPPASTYDHALFAETVAEAA